MADTPDSDSGGGRVDRRDLLKYTGTGAAAATLAGCKSPRDQPPDDGGGSDGTPSKNPLEGQTIKIGVLAPQPGSYPVGTSMVNSAKLAAEKINNNGGIAGAEVEVKVGNTQTAPATGREEFSRLVREEGVHATFGTFLTQVTLACFRTMKQTETCHITTAAAGPKPARLVHNRYEDFKYHFRTGPINSYDLAEAELEFLNLYADQLGWERAAMLIENIAPFDPFADTLDERASEYVEPVASGDRSVRRTSSGITNWTPIYDEVEAADADIALVAQAFTGTAAITQWANQERNFEFGGINLPAQLFQFWNSVSGKCQYTFTMNAVTPQTTNTPRTQDFMKRYRETFSESGSEIPTYPVYSGPITYDGVRVYAKAMENAIAQEGLSSPPEAETLINYLEDVRFTDGIIIPEFQFTPKSATFAHDPQWTSMKQSGVPVWQQWQKDPEVRKGYGVQHSFAPEKNKTAEYSYPDWIDYPSDHPANN